MFAAICSDCSYELAIPKFGAFKLFFSRTFAKAPRSSAKSIASGDVPRIFTPDSNNPLARPSGVCPPS